ncbi:hypothetical protein TRVA0_011S02960 [Trichomonascus vanleenenianus]|uniref:uncharacterized protein n=1 Tax=Trichomonascus vanleenenianus TaxID=2268995 RepID=UPI003EC9B9BE
MEDVSVERITELSAQLSTAGGSQLAEYLQDHEPAAALRLDAATESRDTTLSVYYSAYLWVLFAEQDYVEIENVVDRTKGTPVEKAMPFAWTVRIIEAAMEILPTEVYSRKPSGDTLIDAIADYAVEKGFRGVLYRRIRDHYAAIDVGRIRELLGITSDDVVGLLNEKDQGWKLEGTTVVPPTIARSGETKRAQLQDLVGLALHLESSNYV